MKNHLCIVEDDFSIGQLVSKKLRASGYEVQVFESAEKLLSEKVEYDLFIIDIMLSGRMSGYELCRNLKEKNHFIPILFLSALSEPSNIIEGLKLGAEDYLTKPFEMEELLLRVKGMLKRRSWYKELAEQKQVFEWDGNGVDFQELTAWNTEGRFSLSPKESMLFKLLVENEGSVVSRDTILERVWGYYVFPSSRTVDNFILRLRKYFEKIPAEPKYLHSVRGLGYKFTR
jgi:DNA-binding response OmpR family regulator